MNTREIAAEYRLSHWAQIIRERKESGLSIRAYCEKHSFHENLYFYWQRKLREEACRQMETSQPAASAGGLVPAGFVEIKQLPGQSRTSLMDATDAGNLCAEIAGVKITANGSYPVEKLACLLRELVRTC